MNAKEVTYEQKRVTGQYENDTATVTMALEPNDSPTEALEIAKALCGVGIASSRDRDLREKIKRKLSTAEGRADLERYLALAPTSRVGDRW